MLNLLNNIPNPIDLLKRVMCHASFGLLNFQKFTNKLTLFFFNFQKWIDGVTNKLRVFLIANPLPYGKFISLILGNRTKNMILNKTNSFGMRVKNRYPGIEYYTSFSGIFINTKISVAIREAGQPFPKGLIGGFLRPVQYKFFGYTQGFFEIGNLMTYLISCQFSKFSWLVKVVLEPKKLGSFNNGEERNIVDKRKGLFYVCGNCPRPSFFSLVSFSNKNISPEVVFKKGWDALISHLSTDNKSAVLSESNIAFSIKKTSKIMHITHWFGKLHFTKSGNCPQRLNSMERGLSLRYAIV